MSKPKGTKTIIELEEAELKFVREEEIRHIRLMLEYTRKELLRLEDLEQKLQALENVPIDDMDDEEVDKAV